MAFIYYKGKILFNNKKFATSLDCCCSCPVEDSVTYTVDLTGSDATVVSEVDLTDYVIGFLSPDDVLAYRLVLVFESFCCTGIPNSADNNARFVYYSFYICGNANQGELSIAFDAWVAATYGAEYVPFVSTPQVTVPATNTEIDAFIESVRNSASSGGEDALSTSYFRDLSFGCC